LIMFCNDQIVHFILLKEKEEIELFLCQIYKYLVGRPHSNIVYSIPKVSTFVDFYAYDVPLNVPFLILALKYHFI
jgi:hypothetical protein